MAIKKSKTLSNGVVGEYWRITKESYDRLTGRAKWEISLFLNQAAAQAGASPLPCSKQFQADITKEEAALNRTSLGYTKIKEQAARMVPVPFVKNQTCKFDADLDGGEDV